jgi:hypothetical protein
VPAAGVGNCHGDLEGFGGRSQKTDAFVGNLGGLPCLLHVLDKQLHLDQYTHCGPFPGCGAPPFFRS